MRELSAEMTGNMFAELFAFFAVNVFPIVIVERLPSPANMSEVSAVFDISRLLISMEERDVQPSNMLEKSVTFEVFRFERPLTLLRLEKPLNQSAVQTGEMESSKTMDVTLSADAKGLAVLLVVSSKPL